jgi:hypothetical protein
MKQSQKILRLLFPSRQYAAKAVHPAMCPLYNPAASFETSLVLNRLCLFAARTNMGGIAKLFHQVSYFTRIITFIKTHALFFPFSRLWSFHGNTFYSRFRHFAIMSISAINRQANRHTRTFGEQTAFNAFFSPIRRIWAGFFPRLTGLLSWPHPSIAMTSQCLSTHHNLREPSSRVSEKFRLWSTPEIVNEPCCSNKYPFHSGRSIDNRFVTQKIFHPLPCDPAHAACLLRNDECWDVSATETRSFPTTGQKSCIGSFLFAFLSLNPFKGTSAFEYIGNSGVIRIGSKNKTAKIRL